MSEEIQLQYPPPVQKENNFLAFASGPYRDVKESIFLDGFVGSSFSRSSSTPTISARTST